MCTRWSPSAPVTVTVKRFAVSVTDGEPLIAPVVESRLSPEGSVGDMLKLKGATPPDPVTGVNGVTVCPSVRILDAIACVASKGGV